MANLVESSIYEPNIFQIGTDTPVLGGNPVITNGVPSQGYLNAATQQLANRTRYLQDNKQNKLTPGSNITISADNVISAVIDASGGGSDTQLRSDLAAKNNNTKGAFLVGYNNQTVGDKLDSIDTSAAANQLRSDLANNANANLGAKLIGYNGTTVKDYLDNLPSSGGGGGDTALRTDLSNSVDNTKGANLVGYKGSTVYNFLNGLDTTVRVDLADASSVGKGAALVGYNNTTVKAFLDALVLYTSAEKTKLAGIEPGATKNATDAQLRDRSTHTGTQAISTVSGLQDALNQAASGGPLNVQNSNFTATVFTKYWLKGNITATLPSTNGLAVGSYLTFFKALNATPTIQRQGTALIQTTSGSDTTLSFDANVQLNFIFNGTDWEVV